jgi:hypothetical protein
VVDNSPEDLHMDEASAPLAASVTTSAPATSAPAMSAMTLAPAMAAQMLNSTSALLIDTSLTKGAAQSAVAPAPKKWKVAAPAIVIQSVISDLFFHALLFFSDHCIRNLCWQDWMKTHEGGTEEEFKANWNGLSEEEIKVHLISSFFMCP